MTNPDDELVEAMLDAWYPGENWRSLELPSARTDMLAVLAVARHAIRNAALEDANRAHADLVAAAKVATKATEPFARIAGPLIDDGATTAIGLTEGDFRHIREALALLTAALGARP